MKSTRNEWVLCTHGRREWGEVEHAQTWFEVQSVRRPTGVRAETLSQVDARVTHFHSPH